MPQFCLSFEALTSLLASTLNFSKLAAQIPIVHCDMHCIIGQPLLLQEAALVQTSSALLSVTGVGASVITRGVASFDSITFVTLKKKIVTFQS